MFRPFGNAGGTGSSPFGTPQPQLQQQTGMGFGSFGGTTSAVSAPAGGQPGSLFPSGTFGAASATGFAATGPRYSPTTDVENNISISLQTITAMPAYSAKSLEELRLEDYMAGRKGAVLPPTGSGSFGVGGGSGPFGNVAFSGASSNVPPGTSVFSGGNTFGAGPGSAFGGSTFGGTSAPAATSSFGPSGGLFGQSAAATPQSSGGIFGGGAGTFGGTSTYGSLAKPATSTFGGGSGGGLFGQPPSQQPQLLQPPGTPAPGVGGGLFGSGGGSAPTGAFGSTNTGGSLFGKPAGGPFSTFGGSAPTAGATTSFGSGAFGTTNVAPQTSSTPAASSLFQSQPPTQQPSMTSLFGSGQAPSTGSGFSFGAPTAGATSATMAAPPATGSSFSFGGGFGSGTSIGGTTTGASGGTAGGGGGLFGVAPSGMTGGAPSTGGTGLFNFGSGTLASAPTTGGFSFGGASSAPTAGMTTNMAPATGSAPTFNFGTAAPTTTTGGSTGGFSFGQPVSTSSAPLSGPTTGAGTAAGTPFNFSLPTGTNGTAGGSLGAGASVALPLISSEALSIRPPLPAALTTPTQIPPSTSSQTRKQAEGASATAGTRSPARFTPRAAFRLAPPPAPVAESTAGAGSITTALGYVLPRKVSAKKLIISKTGGPVVGGAVTTGPRHLSRVSSTQSLVTAGAGENVFTAPSTAIAAASAAAAGDDSSTGANEGEKYMIPSESTLRRLPYAQLAAVHNFTVGERGIGQVRFLQPVDLTKIALSEIFERIVIFEPRLITLYPDDEWTEEQKPSIGSGLNVPAEVRLERCWCTNKADRQPIRDMGDSRLQAHIERLKAMPGAHFIDYLPETGTWIFRVDHW